MSRYVIADTKRLTHDYISRLAIVLIPFLQAFIVSIIMLQMNLEKQYVNKHLVKTVVFYSGISGMVVLVFSLAFIIFHLHNHRINTFIDITEKYIIISVHSQTVMSSFKLVHFKKIYVIKLDTLDCIRLLKGRLFIYGAVNCYYDKSENLEYSFDDKGKLVFSRWWYNYNPLKKEDYISINNYYKNCEEALCTARQFTVIQKAINIKKKLYRESLIQLAHDPSVRHRYYNKRKNRYTSYKR